MFDSIVQLLIGTPPETIDTVYVFLVYFMEVCIRIGLFGYVLRFISNLFHVLGGSQIKLFS